MTDFGGIQLKLADSEPLDIGIPKGELTEDVAQALVEATAQVLQEHFEENLDYLWVKIDGKRFGVANQTNISGPMIDATTNKLRNFLAHSEAQES